MRVLITTDTVGGVWTFTQELTEGLLEAGCAVCMVSLGRMPNPAQQAWASGLHARHAELFLFAPLDEPLEWMPENDRAYNAAAAVLLDLADVFAADIVHSNQFCFGALELEAPILITAHSDVLGWSRACRGGVLADDAWLRCYMHLVSEGLRGASAVVAPTQWMLSSVAESFTLPARTGVIANGRRITSSHSRIRKLQAVTAGRLWDEAKNIALLNQVVSPMPILVAGDASLTNGHHEMRPAHLTALGALAESDLLRVFSESAIYICCSRYEPFGLAALEAALCGCAIVASDLASLEEVWADSATYFTDAASLSALLDRLSADSEELTRLQQRSRVRATLYTRERMTSAYLTLYRDLVAEAAEEEKEDAA